MEAPPTPSATLTYKHVEPGDLDVLLDVFLPSTPSIETSKAVPVVVYFHGGGLTAGTRTSWFPRWIYKRSMKAGYAFISADYRLIPPSTGHDIIDDVVDLFRFISDDLSDELIKKAMTNVRIDSSSIVVSGSSAGGLCAYLAALHAEPKPKAVLSLYGMCGDVMLPQYLAIKTEPFFLGREILDPADFSQFLLPFPPELRPTSASELAYHPPTSPTPGYPANPRMQLCRLLLQEGIFLDYFTGRHGGGLDREGNAQRGISAILREAMEAGKKPDDVRKLVSEEERKVLPQFSVAGAFPPTFFIHGREDSAVPALESINMHGILKGLGVDVRLQLVDGQEHSFDYATGAEEKYAPLFDEAFEFIAEILGQTLRN